MRRQDLKVGQAYALKNPWAPGQFEQAFVMDLGNWRPEEEHFVPCERDARSRLVTAVAVVRDGAWVPRLMQTGRLNSWEETILTKTKKARTTLLNIKEREARIDRVERRLREKGLIDHRLYWSGVSLSERSGVVVSLDTLERLMEEPPRKVATVPSVPEADPPSGLLAARQLLKESS